jgi:beta-mannosidase
MYSLLPDQNKSCLNGTWKYCVDSENKGRELKYFDPETNFSAWKDIAIPNNWYFTEVGDYFGAIWFKTNFTVPKDLEGERLFLRFAGVDYYADVWLNGEYLGFHEGMFNPFEFDVTGKADKNGENLLVVRVDAPRPNAVYKLARDTENPLSKDYKRHQAVDIDLVKGHMIDSHHKVGAKTKFRGDGNSGGIWDDVLLVGRKNVYIEYVKIFTRVVKKKDWAGDKRDKYDGTGLVTADVRIKNTTCEVIDTDLTMAVSPYNFDDAYRGIRKRRVVLRPGLNTFKVTLTVPEAKLWWTWDIGKPHMYTAQFSILNERITQNFGIKEVVYDQSVCRWFLNGRPLFLRGMRYISSNWMSEANEKMWTEDLNKMLDMQINSIRIGSHVEKDGFYTFCDEMGFLLWQVFPLHYCVSDSDDFIERASEMIRDMGEMLYNHACLGMWSTFKEPEIYEFKERPNNYFRMCEVLKETLGTIDPTRWIHKGDYREGMQNFMVGCCQPDDTNIKTTVFQPNIVEFGAFSIPCLETLKTFIPEDKLWPPHWDTWEYWGLFYDETFKWAKIQMGNSLEEFIDNSQSYEAKVVKEQIETCRQRKYRPVSSMYLYYWSDPTAMIGSGLLDYYRRPYKVYDSMKAVYTKVLISLEWNADPYIIGRDKIYHAASDFAGKVWVTNDMEFQKDCTVSWKIVSEKGQTELENTFVSNLQADSSEVTDHIVWHIPADAGGGYSVRMKVQDGKGNVLSENYTDLIVRK